MEYIISGQRGKKISSFEFKMFDEYKKNVEMYFPLFAQYGCTLKLELCWNNWLQKTWSPCKLPMQNGYGCYVYCEVQKNGKAVRIDSTDGEADYYPLSTGWMISSINRNFCKLRISLYTDMDDINDDLNEFLLQLERLEST